MIRLALLLLFTAIVSPAEAAWPDHPLRLIVPFTAGSSSDTIARVIAAKMGERLGQAIIVENRAGGSTLIGTNAIAKSDPDGYTLGLANTTTHAASAALNATLPFDPIKDFTPIAMIGSSPFVLIGSPQLDAHTLKDFIALARSKPGKLSYASAGTGTLAYLAGELFKWKAGVDITDVPYKGSAQYTLDLMQGRVDFSVSTIPPTRALIEQGKLRGFAVMADKRNASLPGVPTTSEAGVADCEAGLWTAIVVPAGVPGEIAQKLNQAALAAVSSADIQANLKLQGVDAEPGTPEAVAARIRADVAKWRDVVKTAKIAVQR